MEERARSGSVRGRLTFLSWLTWAPYFGSLSSLMVLSKRETWVIAIFVRELLPVGLLVFGLAAALMAVDCDECGGKPGPDCCVCTGFGENDPVRGGGTMEVFRWGWDHGVSVNG